MVSKYDNFCVISFLAHRCKDLLLKVGTENTTIMQTIIQKMPSVASVK